ncbi:MAG: proline dipeptidase [Parcubacteria group bacterium]|nr:MAG: proline dipeptidase [Parcubacteria group bacterium]
MLKIIGLGQGQIIVKKSKFLSLVFYITSIEQAKAQLAELEKKYSDASHLVYAYRIDEDGYIREKFHNDREPGGSAGQPLLYLLQKKDIMDCLLVVVRYFGGTKLGVGGLIRAYTQAGQLVLQDNLENHGAGN